MEMTVFHGTCSAHRRAIEECGLDPDKTQYSEKHWLGQGLYFFEETSKAQWWATNISRKYPDSFVLIYQALIKAPTNRVLNLDNSCELDAFCTEIADCLRQPSQGSSGKQPILSMDMGRAVFLDYYKKKHDIAVTIYTFEKEYAGYTRPRSREDLELQKKLLQKLHIKHHEKQICVSDKTVIQNTQLYYDEEEEIL